MAKSPAFRFYPSDFLGSPDVQLMDACEVGAYILLLSNAWLSERHGYLPNDDDKLRRWARMTRDQWERSKPLILAKFPVSEDGARFNPRMVEEAEKQALYSVKQSERGKLGGRPKQANAKPKLPEEKPTLSVEKQTPPEIKPSVSVSVSVSKELKNLSPQNPKSVVPDGFIYPVWLTSENLDSYLKVRKLKKSPFVDQSAFLKWVKKMQKHYDEFRDVADMLDQMITGNWIGPVEEKWKKRKPEWVEQTYADDPWGFNEKHANS